MTSCPAGLCNDSEFGLKSDVTFDSSGVFLLFFFFLSQPDNLLLNKCWSRCTTMNNAISCKGFMKALSFFLTNRPGVELSCNYSFELSFHLTSFSTRKLILNCVFGLMENTISDNLLRNLCMFGFTQLVVLTGGQTGRSEVKRLLWLVLEMTPPQWKYQMWDTS